MSDVHDRMRALIALRELTIELKRQQLVREHPETDSDEIDVLLRAWILGPAAPPEDAPSMPA